MIQSNKKKFIFITGSRSEFGQFSYFLKRLSKVSKVDLLIAITGMHLSKKYGNTYKDIIKTNLNIKTKIDLKIKDDKFDFISDSISLGIKKFNQFFKKTKPDYLIIPCDRYEMLCPAVAGFYAKIPIIHFYGGEVSEGSFDNVVRNQISLMADYHFVSNHLHKKNLKKMGIYKNIFNVGALAHDEIKNNELYDKEYIEKKIKINLKNENALVTFHPITNNKRNTKLEFDSLIKALEKIDKLHVIFTGPNIDPGNEYIISKIKDLTNKNSNKYKFFSHLGSKLYHSLIPHMDYNIGNSSSLLYEVPSFGKYSFNIGSRQKGRLRGKTVINIPADGDKIYKILKKFKKKNFLLISKILILKKIVLKIQ